LVTFSEHQFGIQEHPVSRHRPSGLNNETLPFLNYNICFTVRQSVTNDHLTKTIKYEAYPVHPSKSTASIVCKQ